MPNANGKTPTLLPLTIGYNDTAYEDTSITVDDARFSIYTSNSAYWVLRRNEDLPETGGDISIVLTITDTVTLASSTYDVTVRPFVTTVTGLGDQTFRTNSTGALPANTAVVNISITCNRDDPFTYEPPWFNEYTILYKKRIDGVSTSDYTYYAGHSMHTLIGDTVTMAPAAIQNVTIVPAADFYGCEHGKYVGNPTTIELPMRLELHQGGELLSPPDMTLTIQKDIPVALLDEPQEITIDLPEEGIPAGTVVYSPARFVGTWAWVGSEGGDEQNPGANACIYDFRSFIYSIMSPNVAFYLHHPQSFLEVDSVTGEIKAQQDLTAATAGTTTAIAVSTHIHCNIPDRYLTIHIVAP